MAKEDSSHQARNQALRRLAAFRKRHLRNTKNINESLTVLFKDHLELHSKAEPTHDLDLLPMIDCPVMYESQGAYFCCRDKKKPLATKLRSLKRCKICLEQNKDELTKAAIKSANVDVSNAKGRGIIQQFGYTKAYVEKLADGTYKKRCTIDNREYSLFELPCVKNSKQFQEECICREGNCLDLVKQWISIYNLKTP